MQLGNAQPRLVTGPEATRQMHALNEQSERRDAWPYPWLCPSRNAEPIPSFGSIAAPALNTLAEVLSYTVPTGFQFALVGIVQLYIGAGFIEGDSDILWTLDLDSPIGVASVEGDPLPGMNNVPVSLGSLAGLPWLFYKPFILKPNQVLRSKVFLPTLNPITGTPNNITPGAPNYFVSAFAGFTWPI